MLNVLIADDHDIVWRKLMPLLQAEFGELIVRGAKTSHEVLSGLADRKWDLIFLDIHIPGPNVVDLLRQVRERDPKVPVLILTGLSEAEHALRTLTAGASGYVAARHVSKDLIPAMRTVMAGEIYVNSDTVKAMAELEDDASSGRHKALSTRELEVLCLIARGKAIKEIAYDLLVSAKTVATYLARIKEKTGLENHVDIARYAFQNGLVK
jgi:two-component system invasion response regulator UvrY